MSTAAYVMTSLGLLAMLFALPTLWRIYRVSEVHQRAWLALLLMVMTFVLGYVGYLWMLGSNPIAMLELVVAAIFGAGGVFVLMVALLSTNTINQLVLALKEKRFQAEHDALTGLPNRQVFYQTLDSLLVSRAPFVCAMIDLNDFKEINDNYGHQTGDAVLRHTAAKLRQLCPDGTLCARLGGDEFALLLPGLDLAAAEGLCAQIRAELEQEAYIDTIVLRVGSSIGLSHSPSHGTQRQALMKAADIAMYHAKQNRLGIAAFADGQGFCNQSA